METKEQQLLRVLGTVLDLAKDGGEHVESFSSLYHEAESLLAEANQRAPENNMRDLYPAVLPHEAITQIANMIEDRALVSTIRTVYEQQKNSAKPTQRLVTALLRLLPDHRVYMSHNYGMHQLTIIPPDREYSDRFSMNWSELDNGNNVPPWDAFERELRRVDTSDQIERIEQEQKLKDKLAKINTSIRDLEGLIVELRARAKREIEALPVPQSATLRTSPIFWDRPSVWARSAYPCIWSASTI
jgi:hypothetical protein